MFSTLISDSCIFFRTHFYAIAGIILPIIVPFEILAFFYQHFIASDEFVLAEQMVLMGAGLVIYPLYAGGLVFFIASVLRRQTIDDRTAWQMAAANWMRYLVVTLVVGTMVMFGLGLLILPGIYLAARFAFSEFELLLGGRAPFPSISESWALTSRHTWILAGGFVLITIALYTPIIFVEFLFAPASVSYGIATSVLNVLASLFGALYTIFAFRVYDLVKPQPSLGRDEHHR